MSKPTIDDVAKKAGYSKATVSAVINDSDSVKDSTRRKILDVMEELNYRPRASARRGFRSVSSKTLGVIIKEVDNPYYAEVISGAREYANSKGYTLLAASSEGDLSSEQRIVDVMKSKDVDGLIIIPLTDDGADLSYLFELKRRNFPFVLLEEIRGVRASVIDIDNVAASKMAVKYLIDQGHTRIVHFAGPAYSAHSQERIEGVRAAYSESQLVFDDGIIVPVGAHLENGYEAGLGYFKDLDVKARPTAVTCYNDLVALGLLRALGELGISVPDDVAVIGCDDIDMLQYLPIPLSSVRIPKREMGRRSAEVLIRHMESDDRVPPQKIFLDAELVVRGTTRVQQMDNPA